MTSLDNLGIKNIRIDERLIHGQVATMWTNSLKSTRIMVVDDNVVKNEIEKMALKTAVPSGTKLSILTTSGAAKNIEDGKYVGQNVFMLVKNPNSLVKLFKNGVRLLNVTVGNMSDKDGAKSVRKSVSVTANDIDDFNFLQNNGVNLIAQMVPSETPVSFIELIK